MTDINQEDFDIRVGLEVHAELRTQTKIFCGCSTAFGAPPNSQTCPVCLGFPGVLPVLNEKVLEHVLKVALSLNCRVNLRCSFDRKNYYYPDLPKNYQISQNYLPIACEGYILIFTDGESRKIRINNIHMEEDAGKNLHTQDTGLEGSLVDFNRAGIPLLEIVTYPDMQSLEEVNEFMNSLRNILIHLGVSDCRMEEGNLRFEANISLKKKGEQNLGQRVEIKNLNSFKMVLKALEHETKRQGKLLRGGEKVLKETRLWDEKKGETRPMRVKEEEHDYRYFPEPDLVPLEIDEKMLRKLKESMPELPHAKFERFQKKYGLSEYEARILTQDKDLSEFYEEATFILKEPKTVSNWVMVELLSVLNEEKKGILDCPVSSENFARLLKLVEDGTISALTGKRVLREMFLSGKTAKELIEQKGLSQISDKDDIRKVVNDIISKHPESVNDYISGKRKTLGFLVGQVMRATGKRANPKLTSEILVEELEKVREKEKGTGYFFYEGTTTNE